MHIDTSRKARATALNMTPMIDVVFLLITFFMVVSEISWQDMLEIQVPRTEANRGLVEPAFIVTVRADGSYYVGGQRVSLHELESILVVEARLDRNVQVLIRADERACFEHVRAILRLCVRRRIGLRRIAFYTRPLEA
jgi:biopolymer transport protein ExbD